MTILDINFVEVIAIPMVPVLPSRVPWPPTRGGISRLQGAAQPAGLGVAHVGVAGRGLYGDVSEEMLDVSEVGAAFEEVCGEGVALMPIAA